MLARKDEDMVGEEAFEMLEHFGTANEVKFLTTKREKEAMIREQEALQKLDADHDGKVSRKEFLDHMSNLGVCTEKALRLFDRFDHNINEEIDVHEFHRMFMSVEMSKEEHLWDTVSRDPVFFGNSIYMMSAFLPLVRPSTQISKYLFPAGSVMFMTNYFICRLKEVETTRATTRLILGKKDDDRKKEVEAMIKDSLAKFDRMEH